MAEEFSGTGRFAMVRRIGAGGMGTVYEVMDRDRQTRVALKTLRNVDPLSLYRFKLEFRSLAELAHENLLPLYELFYEDGHWFFTMELLEDATDLMTHVRGKRRGAVGVAEAEAGEERAASDEASELTAELTSDAVGDEPAASDALSMDTVDSAMTPMDTAVSVRSGLQASVASLRSTAEGTSAPPDYARLRKAFASVAQGVRVLHAAGKLHRDLKPENVMVRADGEPVLLDFGLILEMKRQDEGDGAETGKRTSYEASTDNLISGTLAYMAPEQATGAPLTGSSDWYTFGVMLFEALTGRLPFTGEGVEMVRAKLREVAPPASLIVPSTPRDLDELCVRLLERHAKLRPDGAEVMRCLAGEEVASDAELPARTVFIGRETYLESLNASFAALGRGESEVVCVCGRSGIGKTTLLQRFLNGTVATGGAIQLTGRCYEQESVPYKAFDNLVDAITQLLLEMPAHEAATLLPAHIQSLARVFPVLRQVSAIGRADAAVNDPLLLRQQAFEALGELLAAIGARRPLVLLIDDLQWGDQDSAALLASVFARQPSARMLVLLSYRSEYAGNACLREFRRAWESGNIPARELEVLPLTVEEGRRLAGDLLAGTNVPAAVIERIVEQARGSAFFVQELAEHARTGVDWQTASEQNAGGAAGGDLDRVLWHRIQQLPADARVLVEMIAVAGQPIQVKDLLHTRSLATFPQHAVKLLRTARLVRSAGSQLTDEIETFHDRVRESIVKFLDAPVSRDYHLQIAEALEQNAKAAPETIASHFEAAESPRASHFYELAGERAIAVLAFDRAEEYLKHAAKLAVTEEDRVRVEVRLVHFYTDTARFKDAYETGRQGAARLGVKLPQKFSPPLLLFNMGRGLLRKGRRKPSQLLDLPVMTDARLKAVVSLISAAAKAAYQVRPEICVTICTMAVNLCLKHGNTPDAAIDYMVFGCIFLGGIVGRVETGYEFGRLALALLDKYENDRLRAEVNFVVGYFGTSWLRPATEAERLWEVAFSEGQRTGDLFHTGCAIAATTQSLIMRGVSLSEVEARIAGFWPIAEKAYLREPLTSLRSARRLIARLEGRNAGGVEADAGLLEELSKFGSRHFAHFHFLNECMMHALMGNAEEGLRAAEKSAGYLGDSKGLLNTPEHYFWTAMLYGIKGERGRVAEKAIVTARHRFEKWAARCPANFALRLELICGEHARLRGRGDEAREHYERAIAMGSEQRVLHLLGLAHVRAAGVVAGDAAGVHVREAARAYGQWGAGVLVRNGGAEERDCADARPA